METGVLSFSKPLPPCADHRRSPAIAEAQATSTVGWAPGIGTAALPGELRSTGLDVATILPKALEAPLAGVAGFNAHFGSADGPSRAS